MRAGEVTAFPPTGGDASAPPRAADRAARPRRGPRLLLHRAVAAGGFPAVLPAPAGGQGADRRVQEGAVRRRRGGVLGAAAVPVVGPGRGRAPGGGALLEA